MTLPTELLELLALHPLGHVVFDAEARVLRYANVNPCLFDAPPAVGMTREGFGIEFHQASDTETNMRAAMSACKALIDAGFDVIAHADMMRSHGRHVWLHKDFTWVNVTMWRDFVAPPTTLDAFCDEVEALVKPWGGHVREVFGPITGPPAIAETPAAVS